MKKQSRSRATKTTRIAPIRSRTTKSRSMSVRIKKTHKIITKRVIRRNPKKVALKRKIRKSRPVHKRVLLHPITVLLILCISVFVIDWTYRTVADNYSITATIQAPLITQGADITSVVDGQTLTSSPVTVVGNCPTGSYVKLSDNSLFSGVDVCRVDNTFHIQTSLFTGSNVLNAQDYNITDQPGPSTSNVTITYTPPAPPPPTPMPTPTSTPQNDQTVYGNNSSNSSTDTSNPLILSSDFQYNTTTTGTLFTWQMDIQGGTPPYVVTVDWGDGTTSTYTFTEDPVFTITHQYAKVGYYPIKVTSKDATGQKRLIQLATIVRKKGAKSIIPPAASGSSNSNNGNSSSSTSGGNGSGKGSTHPLSSITQFELSSKNWLWIAWPSLIVVTLMVISFWLGERQEKRVLYTKLRNIHKQKRVRRV